MGKKRQRTQADREFWLTAGRNIRTDNLFFTQLLDMAVNVFKYNNLPDEIDPRYVELGLINRGHMVFFRDSDMLNVDNQTGRYLVLPASLGGTLDMYDVPTYRRAYANNGYQKVLSPEDSVIIYNNYLRLPDIWVIREYAARLYEVQRTIDVNVKAQKTPIVMITDDNTRLTMANIWEKYDGNEPIIIVNKAYDLDDMKVLKTDAPYVADKLQALKKDIFNECLTYFGITNISNVKKERMITDEVTRNMGGTEAEKHVRLNARQEACEKINKMFGLNISVEYRPTVDIVDDDMRFNSGKEEDNEPVYD